MIKFSDCIDYVLSNEGGYTNNPHDSGGCTNYGITLKDCLKYPIFGITNCGDVKAMPLSTAKQIYLSEYWNGNLGLLQNIRVATKMFDMLVNVGPFATVLFQRAANQCGAAIRTDGIFGPTTVAAVNSIKPEIYIDELVLQLLGYYDKIVEHNPNQIVFIKGWHKRATRVPNVQES